MIIYHYKIPYCIFFLFVSSTHVSSGFLSLSKVLLHDLHFPAFSQQPTKLWMTMATDQISKSRNTCWMIMTETCAGSS
ncbi:hypothetical protein ACOSQ3_019891 [Xanthoceras sorbifolium]